MIALWGLVIVGTVATAPEEAVELKPNDREGAAAKVVLDMKAEGFYLHAAPATLADKPKEKGGEPKKFALDVVLKLEFAERLLAVDKGGAATRSVRKLARAATAINGQIRASAASVRPEVSLVVAERRPERGLVVFSPGGPLLRSELEVIQGPCDPLGLAAFLPGRSVKIGDEWNLGNDAAKCVAGYDSLATHSLTARLDSADKETAKVSFRGTIHGAVLGGEGTMTCDGSFVFDRAVGRVATFTVKRDEKRKPGQIEAGLDVRSTITVARTAADVPAELSDDLLEKIPLDARPERELLTYRSPGGKYELTHDRDWHVDVDTDRVSVLKRVDRGGELVAQCNLMAGPNLGKGQHQQPKQFRDDVRRALGDRFVAILGQEELDVREEDGFRYKVAVQGRQGEVTVIWYYYLLASPAGDHLLATFTLGDAQRKLFADQDLQLIGSLEWKKPAP